MFQRGSIGEIPHGNASIYLALLRVSVALVRNYLQGQEAVVMFFRSQVSEGLYPSCLTKGKARKTPSADPPCRQSTFAVLSLLGQS